MRKGKRVSNDVRRFIVNVKQGDPESSLSEIKALVEANFEVEIDKSTVGKILQQGQTDVSLVDKVAEADAEDPAQAERSGHWPGLRGTAHDLESQLRDGLPFAQALRFPWRTWPDYNGGLAFDEKGPDAVVPLSVERSPLLGALKEHLPFEPAWLYLDNWKRSILDLSTALTRLSAAVKDKTEIKETRFISHEEAYEGLEGVTDFYAKTVALDVAEIECAVHAVQNEFKVESLGSRLWVLRWYRNSSSHVILAVNRNRYELERLEKAHLTLRQRANRTPELKRVVEEHQKAEMTKESLVGELRKLALMAEFPGRCSLYSAVQ